MGKLTCCRFSFVPLTISDTSLHSGSLIAPDIVLSAAHCAGAGSALINPLHLNSPVENSEKFGVLYEVIHPLYIHSDVDFHHDLLITKLNGKSTLPYVRLNTDDAVPVQDQTMTVMGWGVNMTHGSTSLNHMQVVNNTYITNEECVARSRQANATSNATQTERKLEDQTHTPTNAPGIMVGGQLPPSQSAGGQLPPFQSGTGGGGQLPPWHSNEQPAASPVPDYFLVPTSPPQYDDYNNVDDDLDVQSDGDDYYSIFNSNDDYYAGGTYEGLVTDDMLCAAEEGQGACQGDR